eukprot:GHVR01079873.1.p1 GENE.GHVR01079873.1~~GHVR01079873.1.p1  ORF type:complete len:188 (+),score=33.88 GHVR01079873.1:32-595(+)
MGEFLSKLIEEVCHWLGRGDNNTGVDTEIDSDSECMSAVTTKLSLHSYCRPRNEFEKIRIIRRWEVLIHPRVRSIWRSQQEIYDILVNILDLINKGYDPVEGREIECVKWFGDVNDEGDPIIRVIHPYRCKGTPTCLIRLLTFLFADEKSFKELQALEDSTLRMTCNNKRCDDLQQQTMRKRQTRES